MSITCEWLDESASIIIVRFSEKWTLEDFREVEAKVRQYAHQVVGRFDIITDFTVDVVMLPLGSLELWLTLAEQRHIDFPNWGLTVWVMGNSILEPYFDTGHELSESIRQHARRVNTLEDAVNLMTKHRKTQPVSN
jgi:hypothetical protein